MNMRNFHFIAGVPAIAGLAFLSAAVMGSAAPAGPPPIVQRASQAYAAQMRGIVGMQRHFTTSVRGGPVQHGEQSDSGQLMQDGRFVKIAYYRIARDGKAFSATQLTDRNTQTNKDWAQGKVFFKEPYDPQYIGDYSFGAPQPACSSCPAGTVGVPFTSAVHDAQHGNGTVYIDRAKAHVIKLTYTPNVLPPHASSGTITELGGQALPGLWYVVHIDEIYRGHAFLFSGMGTFTGTFDHFRRFSNLAAGQSALQNASI
ncbi:MAG: hypothetical protein ABR508_12490 [Candidatus Baltobacteraceae bacterium]